MMPKMPNEDSTTPISRDIIIAHARVLLEVGHETFDTGFWLVECSTCVAGSSDQPNLSTSVVYVLIFHVLIKEEVDVYST